MSMSGIQPRQILSSLRQKNPSLKAVSRTICNMKSKIRTDKLDGRSMIKALFDELGHGGFTYNYKHDDGGHLTHVFFSHPKSISLTKSFPTVFVMDCTYKTNKYKMPLLDIIGVSSFNKSFYSCFAFLEKEREQDYIWALQMFSNMKGHSSDDLVIVTDRELALMNAIRVVFPRAKHILCVWHIQKNVLSKCKGYFNKENWDDFVSAWNTIVYAKTEEAYDKAWDSFRVLYMEKKDVIDYIRSSWIPYKERFVSAWTEKYAHFGNRASSRAEGAHAKLKGYLLVSTGDFRQVRDTISLAIDNEYQEIKTLLETERIRVPHKYRIPFFKNIVGRVSTLAMNKIYDQYEMAKFGKVKDICTMHFRSTMKLPSAHMMHGWKENSLNLDLVGAQWRIDIRSLETSSTNTIDSVKEIEDLTDKLRNKYQHMPSFKQEEIKQKISFMLNEVEPILSEPNVQPHKGRRPSTIKRKEPLSSTRRDPSQFEIVEASLKRSKGQGTTHDSHEVFLVNDESAIDLIDLNEPPV
ncbi:hypothetical protein SOVF_205420 [Spinacia oleracea]|uniref:Protein FAR1-RELATED SEQUENCE 5 n=1 Tax=Spinacia oleracea TaxID=3562 RepID=A0ABM3QH87_SPIOL|nr:protein FAR1-RELATED SEQUENCE 5-like [Spinacia oleracea]KNA03829.1 hypothetical protein SOVF_205420 [Spinacia oleracea]